MAVVNCIGAALATHLLCHYREPKSTHFIVAVVLGYAATVFTLYNNGDALRNAFKNAGLYTLLFLTTLATSISLYRNSPLHPLWKFKGPTVARTTKIWFFWKSAQAKTRITLQQLHKKYGDIVRIGPNELSFCNVDAMLTMHGNGGWEKGSSYHPQGLLTSGTSPELVSLQALTTREYFDTSITQTNSFQTRHMRKDERWAGIRVTCLDSENFAKTCAAFSTQSLLTYSPVLLLRNQQLIQRLGERVNTSLTFNDWAGYFVYDLMSDLAFGKEGAFGLLEKGKDEVGLLPVIVFANMMHGLIDGMTWLKDIFDLLPSSEPIKRVFKFSGDRFEDRYNRGADANEKDVFYHLLAEGDEKGSKLNKVQLSRESQLIVGAGSDTTRGALTFAIYNLTRKPEYWKMLQDEMTKQFEDKPVAVEELEKMPVINAVVNETLRLLPPISRMKRVSPGSVMLEQFIPAGTVGGVATYAMARDPRYFSPKPEEFRLERWLQPSKEKAMNKAASTPFLMGPFACIGRQFALKELRLAIGSICGTFDCKFAPGFDTAAFEDKIYDRFTVDISGSLDVIFTHRADNKDLGIASAHY